MLSVVIPTCESERTLVRTLACLVPGATAGIVSEVILADGGSQDETEAVADIAGCRFLSLPGSLGARLKTAADTARQDWLMFLTPGAVLESHWIGDVERFVASGEREAAAFRPGAGTARDSLLSEAFRLLLASMRGPRPEQGLLVSRRLYAALGGHRAEAAAPEADLLRRLGRGVAILPCRLQILDSVN